MTISYLLAPNPKWYIADLVGRPLGGGSMYTYRSLDKTEQKFVFQDPAGAFAWPDPILFDENGAQGPFYWEVDSDNPQETYYVEVYDADGVLQWTIDNFAPPGGGGGSIITTAIDLENLVANNVMWRNIGVSQTALPTFLPLAPGANTALAQTVSNAGPDICFIKNNTNATDQITFTPFTLGNTPFTGDVTPVDYLKYVCTNTPSGETEKVVQFPITAKVQNLTNQAVTLTIWARGNSGTTTLDLSFRQFFGDGAGASPDVDQLIQTLTLTPSWQKFVIQTTVPDVSGKVIGGCHNDGLFLTIGFPLGASCDIDFTKPSMYLGNIAPSNDYHTYDQIDGVVDGARTGDIRTSVNNYSFSGWTPMNDGSIGNPSSNATNRANFDTFPLYNQIWNSVSNMWAPVVGGRGASAVADFTAGKAMSLTRALGRVFAGTVNSPLINQNYTADSTTDILTMSSTAGFYTGVPVLLSNTGGSPPGGLSIGIPYYAIQLSSTTLKLATSAANALLGTAINITSNGTGTNNIQVPVHELGTFLGEELHQMLSTELPASIPVASTTLTDVGGGGETLIGISGGGTTNINPVGAGQPLSLMQPTTFMNVFIKL